MQWDLRERNKVFEWGLEIGLGFWNDMRIKSWVNLDVGRLTSLTSTQVALDREDVQLVSEFVPSPDRRCRCRAHPAALEEAPSAGADRADSIEEPSCTAPVGGDPGGDSGRQ